MTAGLLVADPATAGTALMLFPRPDGLPAAWVGPFSPGLDPDDARPLLAAVRPCSLLPEHGTGWFGRPGLAGHRLDADGAGVVAGRDWSPVFRPVRSSGESRRALVEAEDQTAGLGLVTEVEAVPGGAVRVRHTLTNLGRQPYVVDSLEVVFPLPARVGEVLDFTGRPNAERRPQRHRIGDGLWLREGRRGHTGHDSATMAVAGVPGFTFAVGEAYGLHVAWSGNTVHRVERVPSDLAAAGAEGAPQNRMRPGVTTIGGGELLLPGEICLAEGESYATPWVFLAATRSGLDGLSAQFHAYLRSVPAHPGTPRPVNLNVWEAVYFRHDLAKLAALADVAAGLGVERYVLDDGWFRGRRSDRAGLGDWQADEDVWPGGLHQLARHVRGRGMQFGLWIEPEMVNPDSDLFRAHPDWILAAGHRQPPLQRHQLVLDLTRPEVTAYLFERISTLVSEYEIAYVKWDCNRDIIDAGSGARAGAPAAHDQAAAVYALLDRLRARHPGVEWESCASGGGRIDLAILERVQRVWTSDMTDALARQPIQRWTGQLVPSEYLGAHVSAPFSHQTGRYMPMSLRGATALFGHFGIEADLTQASSEDLTELAAWVRLYKQHRALIHSGRMVRIDTPDDTAWMYGVVAVDQAAALMSYVQLDEPRNDQPAALRVPGLDPRRRYRLTDVTPGPWPARRSALAEADAPGLEVSGAALAEIGLAISPQHTLTAVVVHIEALPGAPAQGGLGQHRGLEEGGLAGQVERVQRGPGRGVPGGQRGQVPLLLDQLEHRGVVEGLRADVAGPGVRRHDHGRDPEPVPVVPLRPGVQVLLFLDQAGSNDPQTGGQRVRAADGAAARDVVRRDRGRRRHVVVVPAVLVVDPDQHGVRPAGAVHDPVDHLGGEALALPDVLRVLLRVDPEVRVHDAEGRQRAPVGVGEELVQAADVLHVPADPDREDVRGELDVLLHALGHRGQRPGRGAQAAPGHLAAVPGVVPPPALLTGHRVVVGPRDPVLGQQVEDGPGRRIVEQVIRRVVDQAVRRARDQEPAVGEGRPQA